MSATASVCAPDDALPAIPLVVRTRGLLRLFPAFSRRRLSEYVNREHNPLPAVRIDGHLCFDVEQVRTWINNHGLAPLPWKIPVTRGSKQPRSHRASVARARRAKTRARAASAKGGAR
jgi:hypothetical protein